jgi:16S rRNA (uracil1498-N3)-methyltransferase
MNELPENEPQNPRLSIMHLPRFYVDQGIGSRGNVILPERTSHHIRDVLRARTGDQLILFNGLGGEYTAEIKGVSRKQVEIKIIAFDDINRESCLEITLGLGILKRDAMNSAIQKATELGVTNIVPLETANISVSRKKFENRRQHWHQVIQSACEQSGRTKLPILHDVHPLADWIETAAGDLKLLSSLNATQGLNEIHTVPRSICLLIGPEGGISDEEEFAAAESGFTPVLMGRRILRAETAPAALLSLIQYRWGDF